MAWGIFSGRRPMHIAPVIKDDDLIAPPHELNTEGICPCHPHFNEEIKAWIHEEIN